MRQLRAALILTALLGAVALLAQDYYPVGYLGGTFTTTNTGTVATGVQAVATAAGLTPAMVLQVFNWRTSESTVPGGWPSQNDMLTMITGALVGMTPPRMILWYSYFDVVSPAPALANARQLASLVAALAGDPGRVWSQVQL